MKWGASLNLSSSRDSDPHGFQAHIDDSLSIVPHLEAGTIRLTDLGSGQGFPAVPVAIETGIAIDLIESDRRKAAFLTTVMASLNLPGRVWTSRIENAKTPRAACITARALAPLEHLLPLATPLLNPGGYCLFLKGPAALDEVTWAAKRQSFDFEIFPTASARSNLVRITNLR